MLSSCKECLRLIAAQTEASGLPLVGITADGGNGTMTLLRFLHVEQLDRLLPGRTRRKDDEPLGLNSGK